MTSPSVARKGSESSMRTAIYGRVSTMMQKDNTSLPEQERLCREKASMLGWQVSEPHVYREVEGGEDLYRPQMDRLWEAIIRREVDAVLVDVLDRLSRDEGDVGAFFHHADRHGVRVELASEELDESEHGRNLRTLMGMVGRMERMDIRRRTQRGRRARAAAGKLFTTSFPLYGYLFADATRSAYIPDPETNSVVILIYERVAQGTPVRRLARELEAQGIPTPGQVLAARGQLPKNWPSSGFWHAGTILRILHTPAYWGAHSIYRYEMVATKVRPVDTGVTKKVRRRLERAEGDPLRVAVPVSACPPLVSVELAAQVHARLAITKAESAGRNVDPLATLWRGLAVCGHCGGRMGTAPSSWAGPNGNGRRRYVCRSVRGIPDGPDGPLTSNGHGHAPAATRLVCPGGNYSIEANVLDPAGWADVRAWLEDERNVKCLLAEWDEDKRNGQDAITSRVESVESGIKRLREKMDALAETISEAPKGESRRTLQAKLDTYADQVEVEEKKRTRLLEEAQDVLEHANAAKEMRAWVEAVAANAATFNREQQRQTLKALGARITVWRADYVHADDWPQRYRIRLTWTGFTGEATTLPPSTSASTKTAIVTRPS